MEEIKVENVLNVCNVKGESLREALNKVYAHTSDILVFSVQWKDLNEYLESVSGKIEERFRELESKEVELKDQSFALEERAKVVEAAEAQIVDLEMKVEEKKKDLNFLTKQVEVSVSESNAEEVRLSQLRTSVEECVAEKMVKESELIEMVESWRKTRVELGLKGEQLAKMETDLERFRGEVSAEMESLSRAQTHKRQLDAEFERKTKDLRLVQNKLAECEKLFETSSSELAKTQGELECKREQLGQMEAELEKRRVKISAEKELWERTHSREMEEEVQRTKMESKAKELENVERLIEERSAHCESLKLLIEEHSEELVSKEKRQDEIADDIRKASLEVVFKEKTLERANVFIQKLSEKQDSAESKLDSTEKKLDSIRRRLERCIDKHKAAKKELRYVKDTYRECLQDLDIKEKELKSLQSTLTEINEQVEEGEKKMQRVNNSNEELIRQVKLKQEEVCSINKTIMECSGELEAKRKQCDQVQSSVTDLIAELKSKERELSSVEKKIQDSLKDLQSKEEQQVILKASLMEREQGVELKEKELSAREARIDKKAQQMKSTEHKLAKSSKRTELKAKKQGNTVQQVGLVRDANVCDEKTLQLLLRGHLKKRDQLHLDVLSSLKGSSDPAKLVLVTIHGLYSAHQRTSVTNLDPKSVQRSSIFLLECLMDMSPIPTTEIEGEAIKFANEWKNTSLVKAENPVEVLDFLHFLAAFSLAYTFDTDKVQTLFDVAFLRKYAPSLCKALGVSALAPVNDVLLLEDKPEQQPPEAPIINSSDVQQSIASSHLPNEDSLTDIEDSTCFSPNEVSIQLPMLKYPGRFVLTSLDDALIGARQRGELSLAEPIVKTLIPLLEELAHAAVSTDPSLQSEATKVAHQWVRMMGASVEKSQLEAWAFLQFIVAYGLVKLTKQDETLRFSSYVAHFKHAPKLFQSLGLTHAIPNFVIQLLNKDMYIPAIRFMYYFNVKINFSPMEFLKEQIINLRRSAKEKRRYESQAEANRDAATMREIMELIEDFHLDIDIPVDLILKFMVPREIQIQNQRVVSSSVPAQSTHMQASHTFIQSSCSIATHGSNPSLPTSFGSSLNQPAIDVETYQDGGSTALQGQSSYHAGFKRPRLDPRQVIRPCFNPPSAYGRF